MPFNENAKLISIGINPASPWSMFAQIIDIEEPHPTIAEVPDGEYGLSWDIVSGPDRTLSVIFNLVDGSPDPVETRIVPALEYFSGQLLAMRTMLPDKNEAPTIQALRDFFNDNKNLIDTGDMTNDFMNAQLREFRKYMSSWIKFPTEESVRDLSNMAFLIMTSMIMVPQEHTLDSSIVQFPGYQPKF